MDDAENSRVLVALHSETIVAFLTIKFEPWNRLAQIHALVGSPQWRRKGIDSRLVQAAEGFANSRAARGIFVDTPVTNDDAIAFYDSVGVPVRLQND